MKRGVVMEVGDRFCTVLTDGGAFVRVPLKGRPTAVGEVLPLPEGRRSLPRRAHVLWSSSAAFAVALLVFVFSTWPADWPRVQAAPAAYVSIDINPSVELGIDRHKRVMRVIERNPAMVTLLDDLSLTGLPVGDAVRQVMEAVERKLLYDRTEADIVITSVLVDENAPIVEAELQASVQTEVERVIQEHHAGQTPQFRVTVWSAPKEVLEEAEQSGLTAGQFTFYLKAQASGVDVSKEELQSNSIHQVAKQYEEKQLLEPDPAFTKEAIRGLLESQSDKAAKPSGTSASSAAKGGSGGDGNRDGGGNRDSGSNRDSGGNGDGSGKTARNTGESGKAGGGKTVRYAGEGEKTDNDNRANNGKTRVDAAHNGKTNNGTMHNGTMHNGTMYNGTAHNGKTHTGIAHGGTTNNGMTREGTTNNGTTGNGTTNNGGTGKGSSNGKLQEREQSVAQTAKNMLDLIRKNDQNNQRVEEKAERGRGDSRSNERGNDTKSGGKGAGQNDNQTKNQSNAQTNRTGVQTNSTKSTGQSSDRGSDRSSDRGNDRGNDRSNERGSGQSNDRGNDRSNDRGNDHGNDRSSNRGDDRGNGQGNNRGGEQKDNGRTLQNINTEERPGSNITNALHTILGNLTDNERKGSGESTRDRVQSWPR